MASCTIAETAPPLATMEAKMIVATGHDHCQQLKDKVSKEDPSTMVVVMASSHQTSTPPKPRSAPLVMDPGLLAVASSGSWKKLQAFLNGDPLPTSRIVLIECGCYSWLAEPSPRPTSSDGTVRFCCCWRTTRKSFPPTQPSSDGAMGSSAIQPPSSDLEAHLRETILDGVTFEGDSFLHVMATNSVDDDLIEDELGPIRSKAVKFLSTPNNNKDTPLHCAARADKSQMVSFLLDLARGNDADTVKALLETQNSSGWTVLHEAVRVGNNKMVKFFMKNDPDLARFPKYMVKVPMMEDSELATSSKDGLPKDATSPLYLAILLERRTIAETLYRMSGGELSYSGPNGQNALHAAVLRSKDLTEMLLGWNNALTKQQDDNGSTPLHLAASARHQRDLRLIRLFLLKANPNALYQPDHEGSFPIHVAASINAIDAVNDYIENSPDCAGLRDARGRTFLHVAAEKMQRLIVYNACKNRSLSWILNMQDNDGNTALHLAVQSKGLIMFCALFANRKVQLNLPNKKGETPLDIARVSTGKRGIYIKNSENSEVKIYFALRTANAKSGICREDYYEENDILQERQREKRQMEMVKESTENQYIGSALISTVTFGATFAMPGGYRADDHPNGGTPTRAGRYDFEAFTVANALAFTFSTIAIIALKASGSPSRNTWVRVMHYHVAYYCMAIAIKCLVAAFALGTYTMLAPVAHSTAVVVCVLSSFVLLYEISESVIKYILLVGPFCIRKGFVYTFINFVRFIMGSILYYWPIVVIFCATTRHYSAGKVEPPVQPTALSP